VKPTKNIRGISAIQIVDKEKFLVGSSLTNVKKTLRANKYISSSSPTEIQTNI
jgi:hypothetical protein